MGSIASIKSEIADIKNRLAIIESNKQESDFIPASELLALTRKVNELELEIKDIELGALKTQIQALMADAQVGSREQREFNNSAQGVNINKQAQFRGTETYPRDNYFKENRYADYQRTQSQRVNRKPRISEVDIGKYLVGVLASVLVLIALVMFIGMFWDYIGPAFKFLMIMVLGCGVTGLGAYKLIAKNTMNGFWTSVASCGTGITYINIIAGMLAWELYGFGLTATLMLAWFIGCVMLARKAQSLTFFTVSHIGAVISVILALEHLGSMDNTMNQFILSVIVVAWTLISEIGQYGIQDITLNNRLKTLSKVFFTSILIILTVVNERPFDTHWEDGIIWIEPFVFVIVALGSILLYKSQKIFESVPSKIGRIVYEHAAVIFILVALENVITTGSIMDMNLESAWLIGLLTIGIIVITGLISKSDLLRMFIELSPILCVTLVVMSENIVKSPITLLLLAVAAMVMYADAINTEKYSKYKILSSILYCFSLPFILLNEEYGDKYSTLAVIDLGIIYIIGMIDFIYHYRLNNRVKWASTAQNITIAAILVSTLTVVNNLDKDILPYLFVATLFIIAYRVEIMNKMLDKLSDIERWIPTIAFTISQIIVHIITYIGCADRYDTMDGMMLGTILIAMSIMNLYNSIYFKHNIRSIVAVIMCNINIFVVSELWTSGEIVLITSLVGVMVSALLIIAGFVWRHKTFRVLGLITMLMYVLKISFFDTAAASGDGISIFMVLLGGLICFAISFVYNTLDKNFNRQD